MGNASFDLARYQIIGQSMPSSQRRWTCQNRAVNFSLFRPMKPGNHRVRRRDVLTLGSATLVFRGLASTLARASTYPERPVRLIIPFPPGGGFDAIGRPWADRIKSFLGTVFVENQ